MRSSPDRSKKRIHLWKKALLHFSLCFAMGFFAGFAPTTTSVSQLSAHPPAADIRSLGFSDAKTRKPSPDAGSSRNETEILLPPRQQLIVISTAHSAGLHQGAFLWRLARTLRLVPPPLLWIFVESYSDSPAMAKMLRRTGVMYRHITYKETSIDAGDVGHLQRNLALNHVERHRLDGIVHFASAFNVYTLQFFEEIREVEVFGAWPVAMVSVSRKRIVFDGPICRSSKVVGWRSKEPGNATVPRSRTPALSAERRPPPDRINVSGFAFNSTILWDPERWGRPSSIPDGSQDSITFVHQVVVEDETKIRAIPADCSKVMMWHLRIQLPVSLGMNKSFQRREDMLL